MIAPQFFAMGAVFSSLIMIVGSITSAVLSAMAAAKATGKDWSKVKLYAGIALGVALLTALVALALFIHSKMSAGGAVEVVPGFDISMILMLIITSVMVIMDVFAIINASSTADQKTKKSEGFSAGAATIGFFGVIVSLILIVVLL